MRTSDHPAAKPRQYRPPVFRADDDPVEGVVTDSNARPNPLGGDMPLAINSPAVDGDPEENPDGAEFGPVEDEPQPTREPIETAPQDGTYLRAFWGPDDETGRLVRWRLGRHFNNRRWVTGGAWAPADGMIPLPAAAPTEWLKPPEGPEPEEGEEPEAEEEAA